MRHPIVFVCTIAICLAALRDNSASAQYVPQGDSGGIAVYGTGEVRALPNRVQMSLRASADGELVADAIVKYRDIKRRTLDAFDALKMENLALLETGLAITPGMNSDSMNAWMRGMPAETSNSKMLVSISSSLLLRLDKVRETPAEELMETIGRLLDTAQDSGAGMGPSQAEMQMAYRYGRNPSSVLVQFVLTDLKAMREEAYQKAVNDAKARAERLARLNGIKLGRVSAVQEIEVSGDNPTVNVQQPWDMSQANSQRDPEPQIASDTFEEITFRVKLMVRYTIASTDEEKVASTKGEQE